MTDFKPDPLRFDNLLDNEKRKFKNFLLSEPEISMYKKWKHSEKRCFALSLLNFLFMATQQNRCVFFRCAVLYSEL
ncbi:hypothetical protein COOONC_00897 [Cooperia oncophora]